MTKAIRWSDAELEAHQQRVENSRTRQLVRNLRQAEEAKQTGLQRFQALGRMKTGAMNKTEARYAKHLEEMKQAGRVLWYKFEGIKLRLADNTFLTVDFPVMYDDYQLFMIDVKGSKRLFTDDARAKMKIAADMYPFQFVAVYPKKGGGWDMELI